MSLWNHLEEQFFVLTFFVALFLPPVVDVHNPLASLPGSTVLAHLLALLQQDDPLVISFKG